ncbi:ImpA family type VI secretion system protein [Paracoccus sp. Ld10]|uniref:type VI secretion system protein TssA n=1 Tax=Paracoccus sp. Ld10 TaxID=649158 RepID=UPI00386DD86B
MKLDDLLEPVSDDQPCGPDLERGDDAGFLDYYFEAESRLPERYFIPGSASDGREDRLFDPRTVDLAQERASILSLLDQSRDLRLLALLAQFQILAGRLEDFVDTVEIMAALLTQWPEDLHPRLDRGTGDRRAALEALNSQTTVVMPLTHLPLVPGSDVTLRRSMVATGKVPPRLSEEIELGQDVAEPLRADGNLRHVTAVHGMLCRASDALFRLQRHSAQAPGGFTPELGSVRGVLADLQAMIARARPDLRVWSDQGAAVATPGRDPVPPSTGAARTAPAQMPTGGQAVTERAEAAAALDAAQEWLVRNEPSSAALLLIVQARLLVGLPLVDAIEALMPDRASAITLNVGQGSGFALPMQRLRELTTAALGQAEPALIAATATRPVTGRGDLIGLIASVEGYFTAFEPASPVPLLLAKATSMLDQRFDAIMADLLMPSAGNG